MANPFPGMNPYLERPTLWPSVHLRMLPYIADALNAVLPPSYVANPGERTYVIQEDRSIYPDVAVVETTVGGHRQESSVAVLEADPPQVVVLTPEEVREVYVEIVRIDDPGRVVTAIELLSPRNKSRGHPGRELYLRKQAEVLSSRTHLLEIDLLRQGEHTLAVPPARAAESGSWSYLVSLHRAESGGRFEIWPALLQNPLPRVHVPLDPPHADVTLDLQAVLNRAYDQGAFDRQIDYRQPPPPPPLPRVLQAWVEERLASQGRRP